MVFLDSACLVIGTLSIGVVAWASYQNQKVKKKLLEQGKTRVAISGHQGRPAPGRNRVRPLFLGQLLAARAHLPGSHGRPDRHALGKKPRDPEKQCVLLDRQVADGRHWLNNARELSDVATQMARERYQLDFCDPKVDTPGNAVIHREFEVLVYTWTARLKSFDHQLDEIETEYS